MLLLVWWVVIRWVLIKIRMRVQVSMSRRRIGGNLVLLKAIVFHLFRALMVTADMVPWFRR